MNMQYKGSLLIVLSRFRHQSIVQQRESNLSST